MREMTWQILLASLRYRKGPIAGSVCAVALGATLVVAAVNLRLGIMGRLAGELRNYGANLLLVPQSGTGPFLNETQLHNLEDSRVKDRLRGYVPFLYSVVKIRGRDIVLGGTLFPAAKAVHPWWQVEGRWPREKGEALVGLNVAAKLGLRLGDPLSAVYKSSRLTFSVAGVLRTGGSEEHQVFVSLESAQQLTGHPGLLTSVYVSSSATTRLDETVAALRKLWPEAGVRTLLQVAEAEEKLLTRLEIFLGLVALFVLLASGLSVFSTMTKEALERKVELALMRALGAGAREVAWIFACEAAGIGVFGGILGSALGVLFTEMIGLSVFGSLVYPSLMSLPTGLGIGLGVSLFSSLWVAKRIARLAPAVVLRGE